MTPQYRITTNSCKFRIEWYDEENTKIIEEHGTAKLFGLIKYNATRKVKVPDPMWRPLSEGMMEVIKVYKAHPEHGLLFYDRTTSAYEFDTIQEAREALNNIYTIISEGEAERARQEECAKFGWQEVI